MFAIIRTRWQTRPLSCRARRRSSAAPGSLRKKYAGIAYPPNMVRLPNHSTTSGNPRKPVLVVEPEVFVAVAVVNAVDHNGQALHLRMPASRATRVKDDRTGIVLRQSPFDFPYQLLAFFLVGLHRLSIDQLVDLRIAVAGIIPFGATHVVLVKLLVGVVDAALGDVEADREILARDPRIPLSGVHGFEHPIDIDLLQLVDKNYCRIAIGRKVAGRYSDSEPHVRPVAELLHDLAGV